MKISEILSHKGGEVVAHNPNCIGENRHKAFAMISFSDAGGDITDCFISREQAEGLVSRLARFLAEPQDPGKYR